MYLLDTDVLSNLIRPAPSVTLMARLAVVPLDQQFTSSITIGELFYGVHRMGKSAARLLQRVEAVVSPYQVVLPFDDAAARRYGEVRAHLERLGTPIGDADVRIAAIALVHGLTMVSGNVRHFQRVPGLAVENWFS